MIHRWHMINANAVQANTPTRLTIRTQKLRGPIFLLGLYGFHMSSEVGKAMEIGYTMNPNRGKNPFTPLIDLGPSNGVDIDAYSELAIRVGGGNSATFPPRRATGISAADLQADDISPTATGQGKLDGFIRRSFVLGGEDYTPLRMFVPIWDGYLTLSGTFTALSGDGEIKGGIELVEDILNVPQEIRDMIKEAQGSIWDILGGALDLFTSPNALINLFGVLIGDIFNNPGIPDGPQPPTEAQMYLSFLEAW